LTAAPAAPAAAPLRRLRRALCVALLLTALVAAVTVLARWAAGDEWKPALRSASALEARKLAGPSGLDSWGAMLSAAHWNAHRARTGGSVYAAAIALDNCKYQYPPSALLLMELIPHPRGQHLCSRDAEAGETLREPAVRRAWPAKAWIDLSSQLALLATLVLVAVLLQRALVAGAPRSPAAALRSTDAAWLSALVAALGLTFFPLVWGHTLGQIQVHLNLALTGALVAQLAGRPALAGALLGLTCLFKPNYALLAVWALWRREGRLAAALLLVAAIGHGVALARYGLAVHVEYLEFLRGLSRVGESYWANQSLTGLLHRWLEPASALQWADSAFGSSAAAVAALPAFDWAAAGFPEGAPGLHAATVAFSLALLAIALWPMRTPPGRQAPDPLARALDLGVMLAAATLASPVVWLHHDGIFFALFTLALATLLGAPRRRGDLSLPVLAAAYVLLGQVLLRPELIHTDPWRGLLGSHGWLGALLLFALLVRLRTRAALNAAPPR